MLVARLVLPNPAFTLHMFQLWPDSAHLDIASNRPLSGVHLAFIPVGRVVGDDGDPKRHLRIRPSPDGRRQYCSRLMAMHHPFYSPPVSREMRASL
jgi:hypothetical protein